MMSRRVPRRSRLVAALLFVVLVAAPGGSVAQPAPDPTTQAALSVWNRPSTEFVGLVCTDFQEHGIVPEEYDLVQRAADVSTATAGMSLASGGRPPWCCVFRGALNVGTFQRLTLLDPWIGSAFGASAPQKNVRMPRQ